MLSPTFRGAALRGGEQSPACGHPQTPLLWVALVATVTCHLAVALQVLPPLRDVRNRPEVGNSLRNKLVRLMTHIDTDVKHCAAEFLFVLCKESGESWGLPQGDPEMGTLCRAAAFPQDSPAEWGNGESSRSSVGRRWCPSDQR